MRRVLAIGIALSALFPAAASAGFIPAQPVDGPSADVLSAGDVGLARDGTGAVTYLKTDAGAAHVFVSTLTLGTPGPPQRLDVGQVAASSQPRIGVASGGRVLVTWVNDGQLYAALRPATADVFSPPLLASPQVGVHDPALSMTVNGKAYVAFTTSAGDVWGAYMGVDGSWSQPDAPMDVDPARTAGSPAVAASGDGTALYAWTETGGDGISHVMARRMIRQRRGEVPREVSVGSLDGRPGGSADSPGIGIEYDPSYAWVVFRQDFVDNGAVVSRALVRHLVASDFKAPEPIDGLSFGAAGGGADQPRIAFTGRGRGTFTAGLRGPFGVVGTLLKNDVFEKPVRLDAPSSLGAPPHAVPTTADDESGTVSWQRGVGIVASHFTPDGADPEVELSVPAFGPADASAGLEASADRAGNAAITFAQGDPSARRVVVALYDLPPRAPAAHNDERWRSDNRPKFHWSTVEDTWSAAPVTYRLEIDHVAVRTQTGTTYRPPTPLPDGDHRWRIVTTDGRGQQSIGVDRFLRIDTHRPTVRVRLSGRARHGALSTFVATVADPAGGSGVTRVDFDLGDGTKVRAKVVGGVARVKHRYTGPGRRVVRATAEDQAGNRRTASATVRVK